MGWKNWPSWLKGGVIGLVICIILIVIGFSTMLYCSGGGANLGGGVIVGGVIPSYCEIPHEIAGLIIYSFMLFGLLPVSDLEILISGLIIYTLIGAIIGLIYGKIKSKKTVINNKTKPKLLKTKKKI